MRCKLALAIVCLGVAAAQDPPQTNVAETVTKEQPATFRTGVNLVMVPVVVRDRHGKAMGTLRQEDFQLSDKGKPQTITRFSVERAGMSKEKPKEKPKPGETPSMEDLPERFIAYLFDDLHLEFGDLVRVREAARRHMDSELRGVDRAAIYTTSGQVMQEFTDEKDKLHEALARLAPRSMTERRGFGCPDINYYMADMVQNHNDPSLLPALIQETLVCAHLDASSATVAESMVRAEASRITGVSGQETRVSLGLLRDVVRRMSGMPGQRTILLVSPGFITPDQQSEKSDVIDRAIKANVLINALDARGLYVDPTFDASRPSTTLVSMTIKNQYERESVRMQADVLAEFASGTGGSFYENNNDMDEGFRRTATAPEFVYLLGFSPQNLKMDGSFHSLKVSLVKTASAGMTTMARKGYYAPKRLLDAAENAREEIREALFSREETRELPIDLHSQFFKPNDQTARVTVVAHIDLKGLKFRKADGRNNNELTIVAGLFDRNGNYVTGVEKKLEMKLKDETLVTRADTGFSIRSTFDVQPGRYMIRLVVRDAEGQQMSAQNGSIDIP